MTARGDTFARNLVPLLLLLLLLLLLCPRRHNGATPICFMAGRSALPLQPTTPQWHDTYLLYGRETPLCHCSPQLHNGTTPICFLARLASIDYTL
jgi:hypothetical protein